MKLEKYLLVIILSVSFLVRIINLPQLVTFGGDQGIDLLVVKDIMIDHKLTLLGPKTSMSDVYNGPLFYYMIIPALWMGGMDPLAVSYLMIGIWIATLYLMYRFAVKYFRDVGMGLYAITIFSFWPVSIEYSRMSFSSFPTPLFSIILLFLSFKYLKEKQNYCIFGGGFTAGLLMQLHYTSIFLILATYSCILIYLIKKCITWKKISQLLLISLAGFCIAYLPVILFEVRHDFFNTKMFLRFLQNFSHSTGSFQIHYIIGFFPPIFLGIGWLISRIKSRFRLIGMAIFIGIVVIEVSQITLFSDHGYTMPDGWNYIGVKNATQLIIRDVRENNISQFNIGSIVDGDTRAHPFRYLLETNNIHPLGVENYPNARTLYIIGKCSQDILKYPVWEIQGFLPGFIEKKIIIQKDYCLFRLDKTG